jgi:hypothetical protein
LAAPNLQDGRGRVIDAAQFWTRRSFGRGVVSRRTPALRRRGGTPGPSGPTAAKGPCRGKDYIYSRLPPKGPSGTQGPCRGKTILYIAACLRKARPGPKAPAGGKTIYIGRKRRQGRPSDRPPTGARPGPSAGRGALTDFIGYKTPRIVKTTAARRRVRRFGRRRIYHSEIECAIVKN